jgi:hypothetical protein
MSDSPIRLSLSLESLGLLHSPTHEKDFTFIVGDECYSCPSVVAEFLSPRVQLLRSQDVTIQELSLETEDPNHSFENLLSIGFGHEPSFPQTEVEFVRAVCVELWNSDLFNRTLKPEEWTMTDDALRARFDVQSHKRHDEFCATEFPIIARHFYLLSVSDFDRLSGLALHGILSQPDLVVMDEDSLFEIIYRHAADDPDCFGLLEFVRFEFLSDECAQRAFDFVIDDIGSLNSAIASRLRPRFGQPSKPASPPGRFYLPQLESKIVSATPDIFLRFRGTILHLLYRGSRDGFQARSFHGRCDGHAKTITMIQSTNDSIFGGYTPLAWTSAFEDISDSSWQSFLFTIKNPHNIAPQTFRQIRQNQIYMSEFQGPNFGYADLEIEDACQANGSNHSSLGHCYANDTGIEGDLVLTGERAFTVKEIEVFEVI